MELDLDLAYLSQHAARFSNTPLTYGRAPWHTILRTVSNSGTFPRSGRGEMNDDRSLLDFAYPEWYYVIVYRQNCSPGQISVSVQ